MNSGDTDGLQRQDGFTLIELLLVVTMIGIVAAIAVPLLTRARAASTEASTIGSLRTLNSSQVSYSTACGGGYFAPSVTWLAKSAGTGKAAKGKATFVGPEFTADTTTRLNYTIRFTAGTVEPKSPAGCNGVGAGKSVRNYFIGADPVATSASTGTRHFGTSSDNTIFESTKRISAFYTGVPPNPAKPIQ